MSDKKKIHKHKWSRAYRGIFNGPVRLCLNGRCGAIRFSTGHYAVEQEGKERILRRYYVSTDGNLVKRDVAIFCDWNGLDDQHNDENEVIAALREANLAKEG